MSRNPQPASTGERPPELLASLFPEAFVEGLIDPLFATPERAAVAVKALGAPLAHVCAGRTRNPAVDLAALHRRAARECLRGRKIRARAIGLLAELAHEAIHGVAMKGLAMAYDVYTRPAYRLLPDVDMLFRDQDLTRLAKILSGRGFRTTVDPQFVSAWGVLAEASFAPVFPPDRGFYLDVHRAVDERPASEGLDAERVFARAEAVETEWGSCLVPAREHSFAIAALNCYRDVYTPMALKGLFDACLLINRFGERMDWREVEAVARRGRFVNRIVFFRALLEALGGGRAAVFENREPAAWMRPQLAAIAENFRTLDRLGMSNLRKMLFEAALLDTPFATVKLHGRRLYHTATPRMHYLPGVPVVDFAELE